MQTITTSKGSYIFVPIVKDSEHITVDDGYLCYLPHVPKGYSVSTMQYIELPKDNNYTFLCTTDTITEEIAKGIVDENKVGYINYCFGNKIGQNVNYQHRSFQYALRSFESLLESHNLSPDKNYAICKQNTI